MPTTYVLIDFENVQPEGLALCSSRPNVHVLVFVGATQKSVSVEKLVLPLQELGERGKVIQVTKSGPNALDFHIAFTLGQRSEHEQDACFRIISKDKGFDPLVDHLKKQGRDVARCASIRDLPGVGATGAKPEETCDDAQARKLPRPAKVNAKATFTAKLGEKAPAKAARTSAAAPAAHAATPATAAQLCCAYLVSLQNPKSTRPGTLTKLRNDLLAKHPSASAQTVDSAVALLKNRRHITIDAENKVTYALGLCAEKTTSGKKSPAELCRQLIQKLDKRRNAKATQPGSLTALASFIKSMFAKQKLSDEDVSDLIQAMSDKKFVTLGAGDKITWPTS